MEHRCISTNILPKMLNRALAPLGIMALTLGLAPAALPMAGLSLSAAQASSLFPQAPYAAYVADADTGEVLYSRAADAERFPASITKVMTLYLVFEQLEDGRIKLGDKIVMSRFAASQPPSKLGLKPGESLTVDQAIRSLATKSANDVAVALAEHVSGSVGKFAELMTRRARQLGMKHTNFANPSGLPDPSHVTTARDIFLLSQATIRHFPQYYSYYQQQEFQFANQTLKNHNNLLRRMPGVDGIKTGFTRAAGFTLAASAVRNGKRVIAVVLGGPSSAARDNNMESLLSAAFDVLEARKQGRLVNVAELLAEPRDLNDQLLDQLVEQGSGDMQPAGSRRR